MCKFFYFALIQKLKSVDKKNVATYQKILENAIQKNQ